MADPFVCTTDTVVLELKFTERFPNWYRDLVHAFNCFQTSAAKYAEGTTVYLGRHLSPRDVIRHLM
jgi:hypothetical protein